ncbi:LacI family DNA-binding transcriptional regulator [Tengunoibacter tsumagoiensis]|uniref:LacI family transcriptional regulator n=1 Tax=Tengunoibacter tsumagoiensis TaxID=2014871 RepID=A0A402AA02_9CHLR|nr:LacI family DNA-binding transcriptional regulator [Tengunoibacter tsumagoiensis]GCE15993.1 LacI family transcriptional regulator [Tengunoibacter tsumagoiensis]
MARKYTIDDIAQLAGVSKATVSRVLNNKPDVDPSTRARIHQIMQEVSFVPSITASGLAGGRNRLVGVLIPSFSWSFVGEIMRGVSEMIGHTPYELLVYSINDMARDNDKGDILDHILSTKLPAGLLAILPGHSAPYVERLHTHGFPVVMVDDTAHHPNMPWVNVDSVHGSYLAVKHLIELGHRRIAHIYGPQNFICAHERYQGYCQALEEAGIALDPLLVAQGNFEYHGALDAAHQLLSLPAEVRPTALFASTDLTAYAVIDVADSYGLRVPGDLAVVGFDDIESSARIRPALTTVRQPFAEIGKCGVELLLALLNTPVQRADSSLLALSLPVLTPSEGMVRPPHISLQTTLVVRASCGAQRQQQSVDEIIPSKVL